MAFITVTQGASSIQIDPGVYSVTLTDISDPRTVTAQRGPNAGREINLIDWSFALEDGTVIDASTSTASGPKSKMYAFLTALFGGQAPPVGTQLEKEQLIGRMALATITIDEGGWPRIVNLGALPRPAARPAPAAPTDSSAVVKPRRQAPLNETLDREEQRVPVAASPNDDLPF